MSSIKQIDEEIKRLYAEKRALIEAERQARRARRQIAELDEDQNLSNKYINGIYRQRLRLGINQTTLARATRMSRTALSNIETGKNDPSLERFLRINEVLKYWEIRPLLEEPEKERP